MSVATGFGSFALAHAGMIGLALAMDRHRRQLRPATAGRAASAAIGWRVAGCALLALSLRLSMQTWGISTGTVAWFGIASATSLTLILMLPHAPAFAWRTGWLACLAGLALALFG